VLQALPRSDAVASRATGEPPYVLPSPAPTPHHWPLAAPGKRVVTEHEVFEHELEEAGRRVERRVKEDPGQEWAKEPPDNRWREPKPLEMRGGGGLWHSEDGGVGRSDRAEPGEPDAELVGERAHGGEQRGEGPQRAAEQVGD
jgi:hypothetical protein